MKWKKFRIKTKTEAEDIIISTLYDIGLEGAQIEDNVPLTALEKEQMFVDILPQMAEDDGTAYLSFFVEETEEGGLLLNGETKTEEDMLKAVKEELDGFVILWILARAALLWMRQRILTGSITGSSISNSFMWMTF